MIPQKKIKKEEDSYSKELSFSEFVNSLKELSPSELRSLKSVINLRIRNRAAGISSEDEGDEDSEKYVSSQGSVSKSDPYNSELFKDSQDPYAL